MRQGCRLLTTALYREIIDLGVVVVVAVCVVLLLLLVLVALVLVRLFMAGFGFVLAVAVLIRSSYGLPHSTFSFSSSSTALAVGGCRGARSGLGRRTRLPLFREGRWFHAAVPPPSPEGEGMRGRLNPFKFQFCRLPSEEKVDPVEFLATLVSQARAS